MIEPAAVSVSVIMTCYNEGAYIGASLDSILQQSCANLISEIVIVDDGSDHDTVAILNRIQLSDPRVKVIYGSGGNGPAGQRNLAIQNTTSDYVAILDGDDLWVSNKLEKQLKVMLQNDRIGLVYSDYYAFSGDNLNNARRAGVIDLGNKEDLKISYFLNDPPILPSTVLMRRAAFLECGMFDPSLKVFEETEFYLRLSGFCRFALVNEPLLYKRYRGSSITGGRNDLMAHHAFVALKAAASDPALLQLVPRRLAERARKLGNHRFLLGDRVGAGQLLELAVRLHPLNIRAWTSFLAVRLFPGAAVLAMRAQMRERQASLGVDLV